MVFLALSAALLASCAVGPRYQRQPAPQVARYASTPVVAAGEPRFDAAMAVDPLWWRGFGSATLDALVAGALRENRALRAAEETLAATRAEVRATRAILFPEIDLALGATRQRLPPASGGNGDAYNLFTGGVQVGYAVDLFGANRHLVRSAEAQLAIAGERLQAARLLIAGNVVQTAFRLASLGARLQAMEKAVADEREVLDLVQAQYRLGAIDQSAVLTQQSLLASSTATLAELRQAADATRHLLATLLGHYPADMATVALPAFDELRLPAALPLGVPSALAAARPDIRAAEAALRGANAEVGLAVARLYPGFRIDATYGGAASVPGELFRSPNRLWEVAGSLLAPVFEGGRLRAEKRAAEAGYRAMVADYQGTVLAAFQNVADVLQALRHDDELVRARREASASADAALALVLTRYRAGGADYITVLTNEVQAEEARVARIVAEEQRLSDTAALYVALGGGDWAAVPEGQPALAAAGNAAGTEAER